MPGGSCVCGAVAFEMRPPYRFFQYCHCSRCRKRSGSIHAANIALPAEQLTFVRGAEHVRRFELPTTAGWSSAFCDLCGSGLPWKTRNGEAWIVPSGALDDDPIERPTRNVHVASGAAWEIAAATLPSFDDDEAPR